MKNVQLAIILLGAVFVLSVGCTQANTGTAQGTAGTDNGTETELTGESNNSGTEQTDTPSATASPQIPITDPIDLAASTVNQLQELPNDYCITYVEILNVGTEFESPSEKEYCKKRQDRMFALLDNYQVEYCIENGTKGASCMDIGSQQIVCAKDDTKCPNPFLQSGPAFASKQKIQESLLMLDKQLPNKTTAGFTGLCFSNLDGYEFCYHPTYTVFLYYKAGNESFELKTLTIPAPAEKFIPPAEVIVPYN